MKKKSYNNIHKIIKNKKKTNIMQKKTHKKNLTLM